MDAVVERNWLLIFEIRLWFFYSFATSDLEFKIYSGVGRCLLYPAITHQGDGLGSSGEGVRKKRGDRESAQLNLFLVVASNI